MLRASHVVMRHKLLDNMNGQILETNRHSKRNKKKKICQAFHSS